MSDEMYRERIRSLEEHTDKLVAQSDALKAQANKSNALILELNHQLVERDAEIAALRQQVAELQAWKSAVPVEAIEENYYLAHAYTGGNSDTRTLWEWLKPNLTGVD